MPKLIEIEGLGDLYAEKLRQAGVHSTRDLLQRAATSKGRREVSKKTGIESKLIQNWVSQAISTRKVSISAAKGRSLPTLKEINGLGNVYAEKLAKAGVRSSRDLLQWAATSKGRREVSRKTGIESKHIRHWAGQVDLMRIKGISTAYAVLLVAAGVANTAELALQDPGKLHDKLVKVNEDYALVQRLPSVEEIQDWIDQALDLPQILY